ncbi:MAG: septum formation protein Maf [Candidatus Omnitrophica bacterium]|nr:septum formation protein Maf [Candidatus Omnitrophota bacterium]
MRKIILASKSKQRKNILNSLGLKFKVIPSNIKENRRLKSSCAKLVKENAINKAKDVASRLGEGVVIGADTLVLVPPGQIIGKPRSIQDAKRTLKFLSKRPQWVYTGLAVVDIDKNKIISDYEKTRVFMQQLSDKEIDRYFSKTSPLDKAGGFDIQRYGGIFIRRIEGCFYNVVGLPVAKLYRMLKRIGVQLLMLIVAINLAGCATEYNVATGKEDMIFYGTQKEINLGRAVSRAYEKEYKLVQDVALEERVRKVGEKIASVCDRKDVNYYFKVVDQEDMNAVSLPGGFVYVNKGLMEKIDNDDELACVLAHEVGHIVAKHHIKRLQASLGYTFLNVLASQTTSPRFTGGMNLAIVQMMLAYSREDEFLADKLGIIYAKRAGYNAEAMVGFLEKLKQENKKHIRSIQATYFRTHPYISERIAKAKQILYGTIDFKDYLNIED